ncbi:MULTISPECIES: helix-turn-helix transcriptional regulator [Erwinia]|uniref:AraC family transcriptional regulator n=1 Tax=Erwinia TaxID=551 RepID=UPI000556186B|nr:MULTISPECIES: helix-turn-helix transcriptional regulator [Erwinia]
MRNVHIDDHDNLKRDVVALGNDYPGGYLLSKHRHRRAQLLYGATGLMEVMTDSGCWIVPPQHAVWLPSGMEHRVKFMGVTTRSLYIEPAKADDLNMGNACKIIAVSSLLRQLLIEAVDLPPLYETQRDCALMTLLLAEMATMPRRAFDIPLPQEKRLLLKCHRFLNRPSVQAASVDWAADLFMSESTFRRHFRRETGLSFSAWRQRACVVVSLARLVEGEAVNVIALEMGYESGSSFSTMFRRVTGQSPSHYLPPAQTRRGT